MIFASTWGVLFFGSFGGDWGGEGGGGTEPGRRTGASLEVHQITELTQLFVPHVRIYESYAVTLKDIKSMRRATAGITIELPYSNW